MSNLIRTFTIEIGKVYNGSVECKNPHVELAGKQHIAVNCIDHDKCLYSVQLGPNDTEPCLKFIVTCEECDTCGPKIIDKCFCDTINDCKDCEICNEEGFCEPTCPDGICDDGVCVDCDEEHPCSCNQICQNGHCVCPVGTTINENGCCDECVIPATDADLFPPSGCDVCEVCVDKGGYTVCEPKDCNCDITGKCGTPGACVECINSGNCPENEVCNSHCECDCAPGYTRINGVCVPTECPNGDDDCPVCEICSGTVCIPNQCPPGKVPAVINGECQCVQECNCDQPDCDSIYNYCGDSAIPGKCACLPCEGDCEEGCQAPCICDEDLNKCKYNPCFGPCETGLDCGPTCGCGEDGQCIPCESLDCSTSECSDTLGCACTNTGDCEKDDSCNDAPCSVASDCGLGCTCDKGTCVSCSNFSCETSECDERDGCACNGNNCEGDEEECDETVTLEKDEEECKIIGTLTKDNCCQCPALTLDVILSNTKSVGTKKELTFKAEVRKGAYDGVSHSANPLVDEDHPEVAINESPNSGTIRLSYEITYDVFNASTGAYVGVSTSSPVTTNATYLGNVSQVTFSGIQFDKIESEVTSGGQRKVVKSIKITFTQINKLSFPNDCEYPAGTVIGSFTISNNDQFSALSPIASTITSGSCRKPLFKWTKSDDSSFNEEPFRKIYIDAQSEGVYVDTLGKEEGAESCKYYLFEPDCNCDEAVSDYIVFCNPGIDGFPKPTLTNCGKRAQIDIAATCETNYDLDYALYINGSEKETFTLNSAYGKIWDNTPNPITSIKLKLVCDDLDECTIEHLYPENTIDPVVQEICEGDGSATFKFTESSYPVGISSIVFDGITSTGSGSPKVFTFANKVVGTEYTYKVYFSNGCVSDEKPAVVEDCCNAPEITCLTSGNYQIIADSLTNINYNGSPIPANGIIVPPTTGSAPLTYNCNGTVTTIPIVPFKDYTDCCNIIPDIDPLGSTVTVTLGIGSTPGTYTITIGTLTATISPGLTVVINNVSPSATEILITSDATPACYYSEPISATVCDLDLQLLMDDANCRLIAQAADKVCACPSGTLSGGISSTVQTTNNQLTVTYEIVPNITDSAGVDVVSSELKLYSNNTLKQTIALTDLNAYNGSFAADEICNSNQTNIPYTITVTPCTTCGSNPYLAVVNIPAPYSLISAQYNSYTETNISHIGTVHEFYINVSTTFVSLLLSFSDGINPAITSNIVFTGLAAGQTKTSQISIGNLSCNDCTFVKFEYTVSLEDGCAYSGSLQETVCVGQSASLGPVNLYKTDSTRKMEFLLYEGVTLIRRDFAEDPATVYYEAIDTGYEPGQVYTSKAICSCEEEVTTSECFDTVISLPESGNQGSNCSRHYEVLLESCYLGASGTITIGPGGESQSFTINAVSGQALVIFNLSSPIVSENIVVEIEYNGEYCYKSESFENAGQPEFTVAYTCTAPPALDYDAAITATLDGSPVTVDVIATTSGTITGTDNEITGVSVDTPVNITVRVNEIPGCNYNLTIQKGCACNILTGIINEASVDICVINGIVQGTPEATATVTRTEDVDTEATGILTLTGDPLDTETVTIGAKTYTFQTVLTDVDGNVLIGATAADSIANLVAAITLGAGAGTTYATSTTAHPTVTAADGAGDTVDVTALTAGSAGNAIATTETLTNGSFAAATLLGGVDATWYAVSGATTLINGSLSTGAVSFPLTTTLAPVVGANIVVVGFKDSLAGDNCITDEFTINRTDLDYSVMSNPCSGGFWSVTLSGLTSGATITLQSAGVVSGNNILNIPVNTGTVTFTVTKGGCSVNDSASIPEGCSTCSNGNVSITSLVINEAPCDTTNIDGELRVYANSTNTNGCNVINTVTLNAVPCTPVAGYWNCVIPDTYDGNYLVRATDVCGCYDEDTVAITQNCCTGGAGITAPASICQDDYPEDIVYNITGLPAGYNVVWSGTGLGFSFRNSFNQSVSGSASWVVGPTNAGGTLRVTASHGTAVKVRMVVKITNGTVECDYNLTKDVSLVTCEVDPCASVTCPECQYCIAGACSGDVANGTDCNYMGGGAGSGECCAGECILDDNYGTCGYCGTTCPPDPDVCSYYSCDSSGGGYSCVLHYRPVGYVCAGPGACSSECNGTQSVSKCNVLHNCTATTQACGGCIAPEVCCSGTCETACSAPADTLVANQCMYNHYTCPGNGCGSPSLTQPNCVVSVSSLNFSGFTCDIDTCVAYGTLTVTKASACTFTNIEGTYPMQTGGCNGPLLPIDVVSQNVVGNTCTYYLRLQDVNGQFSGTNYCGTVIPSAVSRVIVNGVGNCCVNVTTSVSLCNATCTTCGGGGS